MELKGRRIALALGGGGALGALHGGVYEALVEAGLAPDWLAGTSIGAFDAAIIAGNEPGEATRRLEAFWDLLVERQPSFGIEGDLRRFQNFMAGLRSRLFGRPGLFLPSMPKLMGEASGFGGGGIYDLSPAAATLERIVDFDRIAGGRTRLTVNATDLLTGEPVLFDSSRTRLGPEHLVASASLMPDFGPVEIEGRQLCDGGFSANVPLPGFFVEPPGEPLVVVAVECLGYSGAPRSTRAGLGERANDILFTNQTRTMVSTLEARHLLAAARGRTKAPVVLTMLCYRGRNEGTDQKLFDFSQASVAERWAEGHRLAAALPGLLTELPEPEPGAFEVHWLS
jgi:NTE family protein